MLINAFLPGAARRASPSPHAKLHVCLRLRPPFKKSNSSQDHDQSALQLPHQILYCLPSIDSYNGAEAGHTGVRQALADDIGVCTRAKSSESLWKPQAASLMRLGVLAWLKRHRTDFSNSKFFGAKGSKPEPQQSKLSFATKAAPKKEAKEEATTVDDARDKKGASSMPASACSIVRNAHRSPTEARKRTRSPSPTAKPSSPEVKNEDVEEEDDAPVSKRPRRGRQRVVDEEDEDDVMDEAPAKSPKSTKAQKSGPKKVEKKAADAKSTKSTATAPAKKSKSPSPAVATKDEDEESTASASEAEEIEDEEEEVKSKTAKKTLEKVQMKLKTATKDPYPDWKPGEPVPYAALCKTFSLIEMTTKRLEIMAHCSLFLHQVMRLTPDDLLPTVLLMINKLAPDYAGIELGIGESLIMKAIGETTGRSLAIIKQDQKEIGDLGLVAVKSRSTQPTMFKPKALTIRGVHKGLMGIATVSGNGAQGRKVDSIKKLLSAADAQNIGKVDITKDKGGPSEAKYLVRFLEGKLRLGLAEKTVLVSLAQAVTYHEADAKGQSPKTTDVEQAEAVLKQVYRYI